MTYAYDAENNRIQKTQDGVITDYVVENTDRLSKILTENTAGVKTYYVYGTGLISQEKAEEKLYYHFNNLGSTIAVSDINGEIVERFNYAPYGELQSENKTGITFLYNGECGVVTDSNGLYYMRARYYNPQIKRFINQDVLTGSINDSPTLNRYAYVQGNPISLTDPFGLSPDLNWAGAGHAALSVLGFTPVVGAFTDLANSIWYLFEGEIAKSLTSLVSALPGLGDLIGAGAKTVQLAKTAAAVKAMGLVGKSAVSGLSIGNTISTNIDRYLNGEKFTLGQVSIDVASIFLNAFAVKLSVNEAKKIEEALKALTALKNTNVDSRKFSEYIFKDGAAPGKDVIYKNLGYSANDSEMLTQIYKEQAALKYANGNYTLGKLDEHGQRINIEIELNGIGSAVGNTSYLVSGWMIKPDGSISLNTPFSGFTR